MLVIRAIAVANYKNYRYRNSRDGVNGDLVPVSVEIVDETVVGVLVADVESHPNVTTVGILSLL